MKDVLMQFLEQSGTLSVETIIYHIVSAALISIVIYVSYWYTHTGTAYSKKFNVSLMTLTILTATVMTVIGNNIALSLGMVGALSMYIFWTIIVGICCGVGDYTVASIGSAVVFIVLLLMGRIRNENRILLIIRGALSNERQIEGIVFEYFDKKALLRVKNTTPDSIEMIYEMDRKAYQHAQLMELSITEKLYNLENMEYVNIVTQSDEISG